MNISGLSQSEIELQIPGLSQTVPGYQFIEKDCTLQIKAGWGKVIFLRFEQLNMYASDYACAGSYIEIYNSADRDYTKSAHRFCGLPLEENSFTSLKNSLDINIHIRQKGIQEINYSMYVAEIKAVCPMMSRLTAKEVHQRIQVPYAAPYVGEIEDRRKCWVIFNPTARSIVFDPVVRTFDLDEDCREYLTIYQTKDTG